MDLEAIQMLQGPYLSSIDPAPNILDDGNNNSDFMLLQTTKTNQVEFGNKTFDFSIAKIQGFFLKPNHLPTVDGRFLYTKTLGYQKVKNKVFYYGS